VKSWLVCFRKNKIYFRIPLHKPYHYGANDQINLGVHSSLNTTVPTLGFTPPPMQLVSGTDPSVIKEART
jgi:hypothetical protein